MKNRFYIIVGCLFFTMGTLYSQSLSLGDAYKLALKNSNMILSSQYSLDSKKEEVNQLEAGLLPQISIKASYDSRTSHFNEMLNRKNDLEKERALDYSISLNQSIYDPELLSKISMQESKMKLDNLLLQKDKYILLQNVMEIYLKIFNHKNKILLLSSKLKYQEYFYKTMKKKFSMQLVSKIDLLQSKVDYDNLKIKLRKEKKLLEIVKVDLKKLIKIDDFQLPNITYKVDLAKLNTLNEITSYTKETILSTLSVRESYLSMQYIKDEINNSEDGHLPKLSLNGKYSKTYSHDIASDYEDSGRLSLVLELPIFKGGYTSSKVKASKLKYKASQEKFKLAKENSQIKIEELINQYNSSLELISLYTSSLESAQLYLDSIKQGYEKKIKSITDLYEAEVKLNEIKSQYVEVFNLFINSYVSLVIHKQELEKLFLIDDFIQGK